MRCAEASAPSLGPAQKTTRPAGSRALARAHAETQSPRGSSSGSAVRTFPTSKRRFSWLLSLSYLSCPSRPLLQLSYRLRSYSIRPGDDIYTICKRKGIDVESVQALVRICSHSPSSLLHATPRSHAF